MIFDFLISLPLVVSLFVRYLVKARLKQGRQQALLKAVADGSLGRGSIAGDEYICDLQQARLSGDGLAYWVETCFCATPLAEERPCWEEYFELLSIKDADNRKNCRHENGAEPWACCNCDCTKRLEERLKRHGKSFLTTLQNMESCQHSRHSVAVQKPNSVSGGNMETI